MKIPKFKIEQYGLLRCTVYDCEPGEGLDMHTHVDQDVHISIVSSGLFKVSGRGWELVAGPGSILDFKPNQPHEIRTIEAGRLISVLKNPTISLPM